jgi:hypothetical protein
VDISIKIIYGIEKTALKRFQDEEKSYIIVGKMSVGMGILQYCKDGFFGGGFYQTEISYIRWNNYIALSSFAVYF